MVIEIIRIRNKLNKWIIDNILVGFVYTILHTITGYINLIVHLHNLTIIDESFLLLNDLENHTIIFSCETNLKFLN